MIRFVTADAPEQTPELRSLLDRALALDRARSEILLGAEPWFNCHGGTYELLAGLTIPDLHDLIDEATDTELLAVRPQARTLVYELPQLIEALEPLRGRGYAGLGDVRTWAKDGLPLDSGCTSPW